MAKKERLAEVVGVEDVVEDVYDDPEVLEQYCGDESFVLPIIPSRVVEPGSAEEVKSIVEWANKTLTPLVPVSSGPPHFRGDTVPSTGGAVIVDLSRMKKVIMVNRRNKVAIVEPGVTFAELQPMLAEEGLRLPMPLHPRSTKSVVGSVLEREPHVIPKHHWDISDPIRCIEVVWGNGEMIMTGEAAVPGSLEEQWERGIYQKNPMGPTQTDFYKIIQGAQGTMGIVTWASVNCELLPSLQKLYFVPSHDIKNLLGFAHKLLKFRIGDELLLLNGIDLAYLLGEGPEQTAKLAQSLPPWILVLGIAGLEILPELRVETQEKDIMDFAKEFGLVPAPAVAGVNAGRMQEILQKPSEEPFWKLRYEGGSHDIFFLTTLGKVPDLVAEMRSVAAASGYATKDIGVYVQPVMQGVGCQCEFTLPFDPSDPGERARVKELSAHACQTLINKGAFFSRPYGEWADIAYRRDAETTIALRKLKGIFDPNNVMNPGKLCF